MTETLHTLSVTDIPESGNGDTGDSRVSPLGADLTCADLPAVTAVTPSSDQAGKHRRAVTASGDTYPPAVTDKPGQRRTSWTATDLMAAHFPPPKWVVEGFFPEGAILLAGPPKVGKSWLCMGVAVAVAAGGRALSSVAVEAGPVLYLALEDTGRRLQSRMGKVLCGDDPPKGLTFVIESPSARAGGLDRIDAWLSRATDPRLVIIDVLQKFRGPALQGQSAYAADYEAIAQIKILADIHNVGIVIVHHDRKGNAEDFISEISGTYGLAGGADTIAALKRSRGELDGVLHITGRDVEEDEHALQFDPKLGAWRYVGKASDYGLSETRRKILAYVRLHDGSKPAQIAEGTGLSRDTVKQACGRMADSSQLDTDGQGSYFIPTQTTPE